MTTKIYGTSDDLIEFEGDIYDEIGAYEAQDKGILLSDGTVLECSYSKTPDLGVWGFKLIRAGSLFDRIEECNDEDAEVYSDFPPSLHKRALFLPLTYRRKNYGFTFIVMHWHQHSCTCNRQYV